MLTQGLILMVIGMSVVFLFLGLIVVIINIAAYLVKNFFPEKEEIPVTNVSGSKLDDIAIALAAVQNYKNK
jgi:oxaloacetate decarboxylase gamma subunit